MSDKKPDLPRIRYTKGPDTLGFGSHDLTKGKWHGPVSNDEAGDAVRPGHVEEYGFEQEGYKAPAPPPVLPADAPPPATGKATRKNADASEGGADPTTLEK